jgi:hypothetical protein
MRQKMRQACILWLVSTICAITAVAQQPSNDNSSMSYELYSWHGSNGGWYFCLLPSPSGRNIHAEEIFNKRFTLSGEKNLKRRLSRLPKNTTVLWLDRLGSTASPEGKTGTEDLAYPPAEVVKEIQSYATKLNIALTLVSDPKRGS